MIEQESVSQYPKVKEQLKYFIPKCADSELMYIGIPIIIHKTENKSPTIMCVSNLDLPTKFPLQFRRRYTLYGFITLEVVLNCPLL